MAMKMNVGVSKKLGLPHYSSVGATCHLEIELDQSLVLLDLEKLHERAKQVFAICRRSVDDELARERVDDCNGRPTRPIQSQATSNGKHNSHDAALRPASRQQLEFARRLAERIPGLGAGRLDALARNLFEKPMTELSSRAASELIDVLRNMKSGKSNRLTILSAANHGAASTN